MYIHYTKPPLEEPKVCKKSKKKNHNSNNKIAYNDPPLNYEEYKETTPNNNNDSSSNTNSSATKSLTISDDDYLNDLNEYQEDLLNSAFFEENPYFQDPCELNNTCNEIFDLFKEKNLATEIEYDTMLKICQDNAKWFLPVQAA